MCVIMENCFREKEERKMNWTKIWMSLFGTTTLWGIDMGFWVSMAVVGLIVVFMNVVFWSKKPKQENTETHKNTDKTK